MLDRTSVRTSVITCMRAASEVSRARDVEGWGKSNGPYQVFSLNEDIAMQLFIPVVVLVLSLVLQPAANTTPAPNTLTSAERAAGWKLLFDGKSLDAWRGYRRETLPEAGWEVSDGTVRTVAKVKGADLITRQTFKDFEFTWEWRVAPGGNNGVKYLVTEERPQSPGLEYQMIDDAGYPGTLGPNHRTADFYDVLPAAADKPIRPAGEWNASRIVLRGD